MVQVTIKKLSEEEIEGRGMRNWPIWTKEVSTFDWYYDDREECLILEGTVTVSRPEGEYSFGGGDFVIFERGLKCVWKVTAPVRKHYHFG